MATVTVPALKPLTYQGRSYVRGDDVTCEAIEAAALAQRGEVSLTRGVRIRPAGYATRDMAPEAAPAATRQRRRYRRRDMQPESV